MSFSIRILCFDQDDPKKCTAKRLEKFNLSEDQKRDPKILEFPYKKRFLQKIKK